MTMRFLTTTLLALSLTAPVAAAEPAQLVFLVDHSGSMSDFAFDPEHPSATRWQVAEQAFHAWLPRLDDTTTLGVEAIGGDCGAPSTLRLPVPTPRAQVADALDRLAPDGGTPLNAALEDLPNLFRDDLPGEHRVVLVSDGLNGCAPFTSTCDIAKRLRHDHNIRIDVVSMVMAPETRAELACVADVTGGVLTVPENAGQLIAMPPIPSFDPWPYITMFATALALAAAARVAYRHAHHVFGWRPRSAALVGGLLATLGGLLAYIVLFVGMTAVSALLGGSVLLAALALAATHERRPPQLTVSNEEILP